MKRRHKKRVIIYAAAPAMAAPKGFYDREHCDQIVGRLNREQVLGGYANGLTGSYYVALPYPVVQETPVCLDDVERL